MENFKSEFLNEIREKYEGLSPKAKKAVLWIQEHYGLAIRICEDSELSLEEVQRYTEEATKRNDYLLLALLSLYKSLKQKPGDEKQ